MSQLILTVDYSESVSDQGPSLEIRYTVENRGQDPHWLLNGLWQYDQTGAIVEDPYQVYLSIHEDGLARLGKFFHPLPKTMEVETPYLPSGRLLKPGARFEETITRPLPLHEYNPYFDDPKPEAEADLQILKAEFWLGVLPALPGLTERDSPVPGTRALHGPGFVAQIRTLKSEVFPLKVPGRRRTDSFERF